VLVGVGIGVGLSYWEPENAGLAGDLFIRASMAVRTTSTGGASPMLGSLKKNLKNPLAVNWNELNTNLNAVVASNDYCSRLVHRKTK